MTTTRIIQREFVVQQGYETLPAVTLASEWSSFMNTYAVWPSGAGDSVTIRRTVDLQKGYYYVTGAVDNTGSVNINGEYNINLYNFGATISRTSIGNSTRIYHGGGPMTILIQAVNTGGPRGVAVTVSKELETATGRNVIISVGTIVPVIAAETIRSVGDLAWSTRSPGIATFARYQTVMPFRAKITAHVWGAGGGGGGLDPEGGVGSPGLYNTTEVTVERGDLVEVFVGAGGQFGQTTIRRGGSPGGPGGASRINLNGLTTRSFNGGTGGAAGLAGWSGGGGGGGGASGILVNNQPAVIAGGGGGGAGGGSYRDQNAGRQQGSILNNATGAAGNDYRGEDGQTKGSPDGGGGGGGGGGYPGGQGGAVAPGDTPGFAGQCGGNFPAFAANTGIGTAYYKAGYAAGGAYGGGNGQDGRVFLLIEPLSLTSVKVSGEWKQISEAFVKIGGAWRDVDTVYIKIDNTWKEVRGSGQNDLSLAGNTLSYGTSARSYS